MTIKKCIILILNILTTIRLYNKIYKLIYSPYLITYR